MQHILFACIIIPISVVQSAFNPSYLCEDQHGQCETQCSAGRREIGRWPLCFDGNKGCCVEETVTASIEIDRGCARQGGSCRTYCAQGESILQGDFCAIGACCRPPNSATTSCSVFGAECRTQCGQNQVEVRGNASCNNGICCMNTETSQEQTTTTTTNVPTSSIPPTVTSPSTAPATGVFTATNVPMSSIPSTVTSSSTPTSDPTTNIPPSSGPTNTSTSTTSTETVTPPAANVLDQNCGSDASNTKVHTRIIHGNQPGPCSVPWAVSIRVQSEPFCSGVLIDSKTVLTTADCSSAIGEIRKYIPSFTASAVIGENNPDIQNEANDREIPIVDFIAHDQYDSDTRVNNIGIVKLNESVTYNACALPACTGNIAAEFADVTTCKIVGFGSNIHDPDVSYANLTVGQVTVYNPTICQSVHSLLRETPIPNTICSIPTPDNMVDACSGDDGGFVMCPDITDKMMLRGLIMDYTCGEGGAPILYVDVTKYETWIRSNMEI